MLAQVPHEAAYHAALDEVRNVHLDPTRRAVGATYWHVDPRVGPRQGPQGTKQLEHRIDVIGIDPRWIERGEIFGRYTKDAFDRRARVQDTATVFDDHDRVGRVLYERAEAFLDLTLLGLGLLLVALSSSHERDHEYRKRRRDDREYVARPRRQHVRKNAEDTSGLTGCNGDDDGTDCSVLITGPVGLDHHDRDRQECRGEARRPSRSRRRICRSTRWSGPRSTRVALGAFPADTMPQSRPRPYAPGSVSPTAPRAVRSPRCPRCGPTRGGRD